MLTSCACWLVADAHRCVLMGQLASSPTNLLGVGHGARQQPDREALNWFRWQGVCGIELPNNMDLGGKRVLIMPGTMKHYSIGGN